jgi:hypothetical protein
MAGDLFALRVRLSKASAKLLDDCEWYMQQAGLLELLLERINLIIARGLEEREVILLADQPPVRICVLKPYAELLLREYLDIAKRDDSLPRKQKAVIDVSMVAGFEPSEGTDPHA